MGIFFSGHKSEPEEIRCRVCSTSNKAEYSYCANCGRELPQPHKPKRGFTSDLFGWLFGKSTPPPPPDRVCPSCGERFAPDDRYCGYDGSQLDAFHDPAIDLRLEGKMLVNGALVGVIGFFVFPMLLTPQTNGEALRYIGAFIGWLLGMAAGSDSKATSKNLWKIIVMLIAYIAILAGSRLLPMFNNGH